MYASLLWHVINTFFIMASKENRIAEEKNNGKNKAE